MAVSEIGACVCVEGYVSSGTECVTCPEHERVQGDGCVCVEGYERSGDGESCAPMATSGPGVACSDGLPCRDSAFPHCAQASNGDQYCTSLGCRTSADCPEDFACTSSASGSYCQRSPLGMAAPCSTDDDCASYEATFCETLISNSCLVQGCSLSNDDCFDGWECCDASAFGMPIPICIPAGNCP